MKHAGLKHYLVLLVLAVLWGSSFYLMKHGLEDENGNPVLRPTQVSALRLAVAALALLPVALRSFRGLTASDWKWVFVIGIFGTGLPAFLFPVAQTYLDSSVAGILNALTPLFTIVIAILFFHTRVQNRQIFGVLIGLLGAMLLISLRGMDNMDNLAFSLLIILATAGYGTSVNVVKNKLPHLPAIRTTALTILVGGIPCIIYLLFSDTSQVIREHPGGMNAFVHVLILGLAGTAFANLIYYWLAVQTSALFAASVTYLMPVVAIFWGLQDKEVLSWKHAACTAVILTGVWLVNYSGRGEKKMTGDKKNKSETV